MSTFNLSQRILNVNKVPNLDVHYGLWTSTTDAVLGVPITFREQGKTVGIIEGGTVTEYWWRDGINDSDLIPKGASVDLSDYFTKSEIQNLLEDYYTKQEVDNIIANLDLADPTILEEDVPVQIGAGNIQVGDLLEQGLTFTQFIKAQFLATFEPTVVAPSYSLNVTITRPSQSPLTLTSNQFVEIGQVIDTVTLAGNFNRGRINGALNVSGIWNPNALQAERAGEASNFIFEGVSVQENSRAISNYTVVQGVNTFASTVNYQEGAVPQNSENEASTVFGALPAGSLNANNNRLRGAYKNFYGAVASNPTPSQIINLPNNFVQNGTLINSVNASTTIFIVALPPGKTLVEVSDLSTQANLTSQFIPSSNTLKDAGENDVQYTVYKYETDNPLGNNIRITIG